MTAPPRLTTHHFHPSPAPGLRFENFRKICVNGFGDGNNAYAHCMAWYQNALFVGTTRANLCLIQERLNIDIGVWPVECPYKLLSEEFETLQARAEIWKYDPAGNAWTRIYRAPLVVGSHGGVMSRDLGYRGMVVYQSASDPEPTLYTSNWSRAHGDGPLLLRCRDGATFEVAAQLGRIGGQPVTSLRTLTPFKGQLFIAPTGAAQGRPNASRVPEIYASRDPGRNDWVLVNEPGFGDPDNLTIFEMAVFADHLYAGALNNQGFQLWRTAAEGRPPYRWEKVLDHGAERGPLNQLIVSMQVFQNALYLGTGIQNGGYDYTHKIGPASAEILRVQDDGSWDLIVGNARQTSQGFKRPLSGLNAGFGNFFNAYIWRMGVHDGWLYAGTMDWSNTVRYAQLERRSPKIRRLYELIGVENIVTQQGGFELWRSSDGENWLPVNRQGFGNPYNYGLRTLVSTPQGFFLGTANPFGPRVAVQRENQWRYEDNPQGGLEVWLGCR